ncbi:MAG: hypothetical protein WKG00_26430 [Polyangiaceae bacterium]
MTNSRSTPTRSLSRANRRRSLGIVALAAALAVASTATAQEPTKQPAEGEKKELDQVDLPTPDKGERKEATSEAAAEVMQDPAGKAGPVMINVKLGPQFNFDGGDPVFALTLDIGYAIIKGNGAGFSDGDLYIVAAPELLIGANLGLILGGGLQYDIPTGVRGLYIYPRATIGAFLLLDPGEGDSGAGFIIYPAVGAKYVVNETINLGVEPFGMPILIDPSSVNYQFNAYAGVNF